jgi:sialate O-acetylesterase
LEIEIKPTQFAPVPNEQTRIEGNCIIIEGVQTGRVRYAWKPYTDANLVNEAGLPASTFELRVSKFQRR